MNPNFIIGGLFCLIPLSGCLGNLEKLYFKVIETPRMRVEWFTFSSVSTIGPEYVVVTTDTGMDTLAEVNTLHDVQVDSQGKIRLCSYGQPRLYDDDVVIPDSILGIPVLLDRSCSPIDGKDLSFFKGDRWRQFE
jgi:hypothetical protein